MALTKIPNNLITADAITGTEIADDAINSEHIMDGSIDAAHMSANSIDSDSYVDGSIDTAHIGDDQVTAAKLANAINTSIADKLPLGGGTMTGDLILGDNVKVEIGSASGGDLQIYHDGSNSYINDTGDGAIYLKTNYLAVAGANGNQLINAEQGAAVELYHNNNRKLVTASGGINITGDTDTDTLTVSGNATVAGTLGVTGVVTANAGIVIDNTTFDAERITSTSGHFYIISSNDILLDADGGNINLRDDGVPFGNFNHNGSNLKITSVVSNGHIVLEPNGTGNVQINSDNLTVTKASSGATATSNSVAVFEDNDNTEVSILGGSSSVLALNFGHSGDNDEGLLSFNTTSGSEDMLLQSTKDITLRTTSTNSTAGDINFKSYNTTIMTLDGGNNNVGIGTASPRRQFHIHNTASATTKLMITNAATGETNDSQGFQIGIDGSGNAVIENRENTNLTLYTNNNPRMTILAAGNVGIGTTAPNNLFTASASHTSYAVAGGGAFIEVARTNGADAGFLVNHYAGQWAIGIDNSDGTNPPLKFEYDSAGSAHAGFTTNSHMALTYDGQLGIGTASPGSYTGVQSNLEVKNASHGGIAINAGTNSLGMLAFAQNGTHKWSLEMENSATPHLSFNEAGTHRMTIDAGGKVGIGTTGPDAVFTVDTNIGGSSTGTLARFHSSKGESDSTFLQIAATRHGTATVQRVQLQAFNNDGTTGRILALNSSGGNVGIGLNDPEFKFEVKQATGNLATFVTNDDNNGATNVLSINYNAALKVENKYSGAAPSANGTKVAKLQLTTVTSSGYGANGAIIVDANAGTGYDSGEMSFATGSNSSNIMTERMRINKDGNVGIGNSVPESPLDVTPHSSTKKTFRVDNISQRGYQEYVISGTIGTNAVTITMQCSSYWQAEVVATFQQSNGGTDNNVYFNGIWSNNHETHLFKNKTDGGTVPRIGAMGTNPTFSVGVGDSASNTGKLIFTKAAAGGTSGTFCVYVRAYGYNNQGMTFVVS